MRKQPLCLPPTVDGQKLGQRNGQCRNGVVL